jgi:hypothetical protein
MGGFEYGRLTNELAAAARDAMDRHDLELDPSSQEQLGELVNRAVEVVQAGGPDDARRAQRAFDRLARGAADLAPLGVAGPAQISRADLVAVLGKFCPGFWPFC